MYVLYKKTVYYIKTATNYIKQIKLKAKVHRKKKVYSAKIR